MEVNGLQEIYFPKAVKNMEDLGLTLEDHTCKQVQLHSAVRNIAQLRQDCTIRVW